MHIHSQKANKAAGAPPKNKAKAKKVVQEAAEDTEDDEDEEDEVEDEPDPPKKTKKQRLAEAARQKAADKEQRQIDKEAARKVQYHTFHVYTHILCTTTRFKHKHTLLNAYNR
jgi:hypothetical protein